MNITLELAEDIAQLSSAEWHDLPRAALDATRSRRAPSAPRERITVVADAYFSLSKTLL